MERLAPRLEPDVALQLLRVQDRFGVPLQHRTPVGGEAGMLHAIAGGTRAQR